MTTSPTHRRRPLARAVLIVLAIEVGLLLLTLPWTRLWDHSVWIARMPAGHVWLGTLLRSDFLRGGVSGLGLINLWIAASEITAASGLRRPAAPERSAGPPAEVSPAPAGSTPVRR